MSDRRTREQHRRKFQELINPENRSKRFRSDTPSSRGGNNIPSSSRGEGNNIPSSRGEGNNIPTKAIISPAAKVEATIFPATEAKEIITPPSATTIPQQRRRRQ